MKFSKNSRPEGQTLYNFEHEKYKATARFKIESIYDEAKFYEDIELFGLDGLEPESQLDTIVRLVKYKTRITQYEIFKIGDLLCKAKKVCLKNKVGFKDWISKNFDFSYETANNFMNVCRNCFHRIDVALHIPPSILYKISSSSFPDKLREYLFEEGNLKEITGGELENLMNRYEEGGLEAVQEDVEEISRISLADRQIRRRFDLIENYLRNLYQIKTTYQRGYNKLFPLEDQLKHLEPEAASLSQELNDAIENSYKLLNNALVKAKNRHILLLDRAKELM